MLSEVLSMMAFLDYIPWINMNFTTWVTQNLFFKVELLDAKGHEKGKVV